MHAVREGPANQSYGLQVAALAGIPRSVIEKARVRLRELETKQASREDIHQQLNLFPPPEAHPVVRSVSEIDPDSLSPRDALGILYRLKQILATAS